MGEARAEQLRRDDPHFVRDLHESKDVVAIVADWLERTEGFPVERPALRVRPDESVRHLYRDFGDCFQIRPDGRIRIEVKGNKKFDFTNAESFPYPNALVDECHKVSPDTERYILPDRSRTHCGVIWVARTRGRWFKAVIPDRDRNREIEVYKCPVDLIEFHDMRVSAPKA